MTFLKVIDSQIEKSTEKKSKFKNNHFRYSKYGNIW